jgi:subtilisin family serine protease
MSLAQMGWAKDDLKTRLIVRLQPGAAPLAIAKKYGLTLKDSAIPFAYFEGSSEAVVSIAQAAMALDPKIAWAEDDEQTASPENTGGGRGGTIPAITNDQINRQYNAAALTQVGWPIGGENAPEALRLVKVAILDSGLSPNAKSVVAKTIRVSNSVDAFGWHDFGRNQDTNGDGKVDHMAGHGSMVASIVSMMSSSARFIIVRAVDSDGFGSAWSLTKALVYAVNQGAEIANLSLGSSTKVPALSDVLDWAVEEKGLIVVAAIGNGAIGKAIDPASSSKVICVTGVGPDDRKATFSNWSGDADVAAPTLSLRGYHLNGSLASWSGTSFSAPLVTGGIVDILSHLSRKVTPNVLISALKASGQNIDGKNPAFKGKMGRRLDAKGTYGWLKAHGY